MFSVGQLVVCVDDSIGNWRIRGQKYVFDLGGLQKGKIYTIRETLICPLHNHPAVRLVEIIRPSHIVYRGEAPFSMRRFRPVVETRLDVFREMLAPVPGVKQKECV